jgi:hypothetical protein
VLISTVSIIVSVWGFAKSPMQYEPKTRELKHPSGIMWPFLSGLTGALAFLLTIGPAPLIPDNIAWLQTGDAATYYLGWAFYRSEPWHIPPGATTHYGIELGKAIFYTDSIPLFAIPLKLFSFALGPVFQYFGYWLLLCFVLQGVAAWLVINRYVAFRVVKFGFVVLCLFIPIFLGRVIQNGHLALAGQFLILLALYAYGNQSLRFPGTFWAIIVSASSVTEPYLFVMVGGIWAAHVVHAVLTRQGSTFVMLGSILVVPVAAASIIMWTAGAFTLGSGLEAPGYGTYRANLFALFDGRNWSYFWPALPKTSTEVAGTNFCGTGLLLVYLVAILLLLLRRVRLQRSSKYAPLILVLAGMFLFALTNKVSAGPFLLELPLDDRLMQIASLLRASERFLWPITYAVSVLAIIVVAQGLRPLACSIVVVVAAGLQVADTGYGWRNMRTRFEMNAPIWTTPLTSEFWKFASIGKKSIRRIPTGNALPQYDVIAYYALTHSLVTDSVYQSRMDADKLATVNAAGIRAITTGQYEPDVLYVVSSELVALAKHSLKLDDVLVAVDGFFVVAPGWLECQPCVSVPVRIVASGRPP